MADEEIELLRESTRRSGHQRRGALSQRSHVPIGIDADDPVTLDRVTDLTSKITELTGTVLTCHGELSCGIATIEMTDLLPVNRLFHRSDMQSRQ